MANQVASPCRFMRVGTFSISIPSILPAPFGVAGRFGTLPKSLANTKVLAKAQRLDTDDVLSAHRAAPCLDMPSPSQQTDLTPFQYLRG